MLAATLSLLDLLAGRFEVAHGGQLHLVGTGARALPVSRRPLGDIVGWVADTRVRWGLDTRHRATRGMPESVTGNTWRLALDRLLLGSAVADDTLVLTMGGVAPHGVETGANETLGSLAAILGHVALLTEWAAEWAGFHPGVAGAPPVDLRRAVRGPDDCAMGVRSARPYHRGGPRGGRITAPGGGDRLLDLGDIRRLLDGKLQDAVGRPNFSGVGSP